jgi:hypothetical protein
LRQSKESIELDGGGDGDDCGLNTLELLGKLLKEVINSVITILISNVLF